MPWIDPWGALYEALPDRIRLADHTTRTAEAATPEAAIAGGWTLQDSYDQSTVIIDPALPTVGNDSIGGGFDSITAA